MVTLYSLLFAFTRVVTWLRKLDTLFPYKYQEKGVLGMAGCLQYRLNQNLFMIREVQDYLLSISWLLLSHSNLFNILNCNELSCLLSLDTISSVILECFDELELCFYFTSTSVLGGQHHRHIWVLHCFWQKHEHLLETALPHTPQTTLEQVMFTQCSWAESLI